MSRKETLKQTRDKRLNQTCRVFELKIVSNKLSLEKKNYLKHLFLEAKWLYNYQLHAVFNIDTKIREVEVLKNETFQTRKLETLSSQMIQELIYRTQNNVKALSRIKDKDKVGELKHKSFINSIPLKQFNKTYKIIGSYIKLQGFKPLFKVRGVDQLEGYEFANANLIRKNDEYFIKVTCFCDKKIKDKTGNIVGLDFGIKDSVTTSNGEKFKFEIPETERLKRISRKFNRTHKTSKNHYKLQIKLNREYERINNKRKDIRKKFVAKLLNNNDLIAIQDEQIHKWVKENKRFGRKISHGIIGGIISDLKYKSETVIISKWYKSTQICSNCGNNNKLKLSERIYKCSCGLLLDRDVNSALNILNESLRSVEESATAEARAFRRGWLTGLNRKEGLIDKNGTILLEPEKYDRIMYFDDKNIIACTGFCSRRTDFLLEINGKEITHANHGIRPSKNGFIVAKTTFNKIDASGNSMEFSEEDKKYIGIYTEEI